MENHSLKNLEDTVEFLKGTGMEYAMITHEAVPTVASMLENVIFEEETCMAKNLFLKDKKKKLNYLVVAQHDTKVDMKILARHLGTGGSNLRNGETDQMQEMLGVLPGSVNLFSIINDTDGKVGLIMDKKVHEASFVAVHPMTNTATCQISNDLMKFVIERSDHEADIVDFDQLAEASAGDAKAPKEKKEKKKDKSKQKANKIEGAVKIGIEYSREDNFSEWYTQVITKSEMIEYYEISGCYILRPWAYGIWEKIQFFLNKLITDSGVENCYFPMFVSEDALKKEEQHLEGFAPEVAWVTRSGNTPMAKPIAIRPTSETIMYPAFANWVQSHRDLPIRLNQWTNIVRWEFKHPTPFIRTREFLWQEGHTAHATEEEAKAEVFDKLESYAKTYEQLLAVPVVRGIKSRGETFAGADFSSTVELFVKANGRGIQGATSHMLGQNFSKMFKISFEDHEAKKALAWQTSWGFTTRSIGAMIMVHGDDHGLVLPPRVASIQVVLVPITKKNDHEEVVAKTQEIADLLKQSDIRVRVDDRDNYKPGWKFNHWEVKGVPLRIELGRKDMDQGQITVVRRDTKNRFTVSLDEDITQRINAELVQMQQDMYDRALQERDSHMTSTTTWEGFMAELNLKHIVMAPWCEELECEDAVKERSKEESLAAENEGEETLTGSAKTLCVPLEQKPLEEGAICFACGKEAKKRALWGRSY